MPAQITEESLHKSKGVLFNESLDQYMNKSQENS